MPYSRSYNSPYLGSSPYPTGRSPLVLDLENKINAVTQQIIDNRKQEIKEKNLEIDKTVLVTEETATDNDNKAFKKLPQICQMKDIRCCNIVELFQKNFLCLLYCIFLYHNF